MRITKFTAIGVSLLLLSGCATLFGKKYDTLTIHSTYSDAILLVNGNEIGKGSATYNLPRDKTAIITAHKKGCSDMTLATNQEINNTTFINLIFWPGYLIDAASGSIHEASSTDYTINPICRKKEDD